MPRVLLSLSFLLLFSACSNQESAWEVAEAELKPGFSTEVIYGEDDRKDLYEVLDEDLKQAARATMGIFDSRGLNFLNDSAIVSTRSLNLCPDEKFVDQKAGPICSGFLVGPDLMLTAGHCVTSERQCRDLIFAFDYAKSSTSNDPSVLSRSSVYRCKKLIGQELTSRDQDWALVQLDRPVLDRQPLEIERSNITSIGTPLTIIGHPSGLPSKIARGGSVQRVEDRHFVADLDSFAGNSGSAVLNADTLKVEGILVRGRTDYRRVNGCNAVNFCEEGIGTSCRFSPGPLAGEHVSKTSDLIDLIPPLTETAPKPEEPIDSNRFVSNQTLPIPDSFREKILSPISNVPALSGSNILVRLVVEHTYISDLRITLIAPNGRRSVLHGNTGRRVININEIYGFSARPFQPLSSLGIQPPGTWSLEIQDSALFDKGYLIEWEIIPVN